MAPNSWVEGPRASGSRGVCGGWRGASELTRWRWRASERWKRKLVGIWSWSWGTLLPGTCEVCGLVRWSWSASSWIVEGEDCGFCRDEWMNDCADSRWRQRQGVKLNGSSHIGGVFKEVGLNSHVGNWWLPICHCFFLIITESYHVVYPPRNFYFF